MKFKEGLGLLNGKRYVHGDLYKLIATNFSSPNKIDLLDDSNMTQLYNECLGHVLKR